MADSDNGLYLAAYEIANPKRLSKIHRTLKKTRIVNSVFGLYCCNEAKSRIETAGAFAGINKTG
ncbi:MAG: CRISPR-associated endonuclease Cas2 [Methylococcales bacterium]